MGQNEPKSRYGQGGRFWPFFGRDANKLHFFHHFGPQQVTTGHNKSKKIGTGNEQILMGGSKWPSVP